MKNKLSFLIVFSLIISLFIPCFSFASEFSEDVVINMQINNPIMTVNGIQTEIDAGRNTKPVIENGRTLVPIRAIIESIGGRVEWENETQSTLLYHEDDIIKLQLNNFTAYVNNKPYTLDVCPIVINERTMLPIRFIAEGFNLAVSWNENSKTVVILKNGLDDSEYTFLTTVPEYSGSPYYITNMNIPFFKTYEKIDSSFEFYDKLDDLKRCGVCFASVSEDIMPTDERESISSVTPSGWINASYDNVPGKYLYNRCHLLGYQLTGENANNKNLITGTRYLNIEGMLPFENMVADYIKETGNHVLYRVTPFFKDNNLVASGVLMEAYSLEDNGAGICFCVYCYNIQPDITINYKTGESYYKEAPDETINSSQKVYRTPTGKKYHYDINCGGKNSIEVTYDEAIKKGLTPCSKCVN